MLAAELGFEPRQTVPETGVLPLHNSAMLNQSTHESISNTDMEFNIKFTCDISRFSLLTRKAIIASIKQDLPEEAETEVPKPQASRVPFLHPHRLGSSVSDHEARMQDDMWSL